MISVRPAVPAGAAVAAAGAEVAPAAGGAAGAAGVQAIDRVSATVRLISRGSVEVRRECGTRGVLLVRWPRAKKSRRVIEISRANILETSPLGQRAPRLTSRTPSRRTHRPCRSSAAPHLSTRPAWPAALRWRSLSADSAHARPGCRVGAPAQPGRSAARCRSAEYRRSVTPRATPALDPDLEL